MSIFQFNQIHHANEPMQNDKPNQTKCSSVLFVQSLNTKSFDML